MKKLALAIALIIGVAVPAHATSVMPKRYLGHWCIDTDRNVHQAHNGQTFYRRGNCTSLTVRPNGFVEDGHDLCRLTAIEPNLTGVGQKGWNAKFVCSHDDQTIPLSAWIGSYLGDDLAIENSN